MHIMLSGRKYIMKIMFKRKTVKISFRTPKFQHGAQHKVQRRFDVPNGKTYIGTYNE